jgi:SAM-dependent methyltransferase
LNPKFDPNEYWQDRVGEDATVGVVGHRSLGVAYNEYIYRRRVDVLDALLDEMQIDVVNMSLLDVGCGSGFYTEYWQHKGVRDYVGVDLSHDTIGRLSDEYPDYRFRQGDITAASGDDKMRAFDIITVFDVFYHIVDDERLVAALGNIRDQLNANGLVLVFEQLTKDDYFLRKHVKFRGRDHYRKLLSDTGFEIAESRHLFNILVPPLTGHRWLDIPIAGLYKVLGFPMIRIPVLGRFFGRLFYEIDKLLLRIGIRIPNNELFVLRRKG